MPACCLTSCIVVSRIQFHLSLTHTHTHTHAHLLFEFSRRNFLFLSLSSSPLLSSSLTSHKPFLSASSDPKSPLQQETARDSAHRRGGRAEAKGKIVPRPLRPPPVLSRVTHSTLREQMYVKMGEWICVYCVNVCVRACKHKVNICLYLRKESVRLSVVCACV